MAICHPFLWMFYVPNLVLNKARDQVNANCQNSGIKAISQNNM